MDKSSIILKGIQVNNLKNIDVAIPENSVGENVQEDKIRNFCYLP